MDVKILFFQAAVTVIPALFIAYVIASRGAESPHTDGRTDKSDAYITIGFVFLIVFGEMISLVTLATDRPSLWAFVVVSSGIIYMFTMIVDLAISPRLKKERINGAEWIFPFWGALGISIGTAIVFLFLHSSE